MTTEIDTLLAQTEERIAALKDDLRLEERLRERLLAVVRQKPSPSPSSSPATPAGQGNGETNQIANGGHRPAGKTVPGSLISRIVAVLEEAGHSLKVKDIADLVSAQGYSTNAVGGVPVAVSAALAHNAGKIFFKVAYGKYDLKSRHEAEA